MSNDLEKLIDELNERVDTMQADADELLLECDETSTLYFKVMGPERADIREYTDPMPVVLGVSYGGRR